MEQMNLLDYRKNMSWFVLFLLGPAAATVSRQRPNIVFIMADDMGWNDVSFHGSDQILTPNIDALAYDGVSLHRYYSHSTCTPSRAALLTSKYPHKIGMQGYPITNSEDRGIPLSEKLLPSYMKDLGYKTHLVGKWHGGASRVAYLPTERGFDSHFGYRNGGIDYYKYTAEETWTTGSVSGLDLYRNKTAGWDVTGYITEIFTEEAVNVIKCHDTSSPLYLHLAHLAPHAGAADTPLQAPQEAVTAHSHVQLEERRILAGMMSKLDEGIGAVVQALAVRNMLNNSIIIFVSDNGGASVGQSRNWASNWPFRGGKWSPYEGGVRNAAFIWSSEIPRGQVWSGLMHVTDWLPTLLHAVGGEIPKGIDGVNQWDSILNLKESKRNKTIVEINDYSSADGGHKFGALISGDYKLIMGTVDDVYSQEASEDLLGVIGEPPSYQNALKSGVTYKVLERIGRSLDMNQVQDLRMRMKMNCTKSEDVLRPSSGETCSYFKIPFAASHYLFNIVEDPCEQHDLSVPLSDLYYDMARQLLEEWNEKIPRQPLFRDPLSHPKWHNNTWAPWL